MVFEVSHDLAIRIYQGLPHGFDDKHLAANKDPYLQQDSIPHICMQLLELRPEGRFAFTSSLIAPVVHGQWSEHRLSKIWWSPKTSNGNSGLSIKPLAGRSTFRPKHGTNTDPV